MQIAPTEEMRMEIHQGTQGSRPRHQCLVQRSSCAGVDAQGHRPNYCSARPRRVRVADHAEAPEQPVSVSAACSTPYDSRAMGLDDVRAVHSAACVVTWSQRRAGQTQETIKVRTWPGPPAADPALFTPLMPNHSMMHHHQARAFCSRSFRRRRWRLNLGIIGVDPAAIL